MSKKKETEIDQIIQKCKDLNFEHQSGSWFKYDLPFGNDTRFYIDTENLIVTIDTYSTWHQDNIETPIRKIESPEDLEILFNAICPEKYRLPFN